MSLRCGTACPIVVEFVAVPMPRVCAAVQWPSGTRREKRRPRVVAASRLGARLPDNARGVAGIALPTPSWGRPGRTHDRPIEHVVIVSMDDAASTANGEFQAEAFRADLFLLYFPAGQKKSHPAWWRPAGPSPVGPPAAGLASHRAATAHREYRCVTGFITARPGHAEPPRSPRTALPGRD